MHCLLLSSGYVRYVHRRREWVGPCDERSENAKCIEAHNLLSITQRSGTLVCCVVILVGKITWEVYWRDNSVIKILTMICTVIPDFMVRN
jgi:hypothetical protein